MCGGGGGGGGKGGREEGRKGERKGVPRLSLWHSEWKGKQQDLVYMFQGRKGSHGVCVSGVIVGVDGVVLVLGEPM